MHPAEPSEPIEIDEPHVTPIEVARTYKFSTDFIINTFVNEPDVIIVGNPEPVYRRNNETGERKLVRRYRSLRIPASAIARVFGKMRGRKRRSRA